MMYRPTVIVGPTQEPLSLQDAKKHLRVDGTSDDAYIDDLIVCAREYCEEAQGRAYFLQTLEFTMDQWPYENDIYIRHETYRFALPRATPLRSVESIIYKDQYGVATTWDSANYIVDTDSDPGQIVLPYGAIWPIFNLYPSNAIRIRYTVGLDPASPVRPFPVRTRHAMRLLIGHWFENREAATIGTLMQSGELVIGVKDLLSFDWQPSF